jgi:hypothetical protein
MTNLTEQDLKRIETIEGYLRQLDICNPEYSLPQFKPYQPIDTTEGEQEQGKEQAPIETEQRWKVEVVRTITDDCGIYITRNIPLRKLKAEEIAEAIKQYLSINQF